MVDIHTHILSQLDDGAETPKTSVLMCALASNAGTRAIIATPHFVEGNYDKVNKETVRKKVDSLNKILVENKINIEVYPGCEAFLSLELPELVQSGKCISLNESHYLLIELPASSIPLYTDDILYELEIQGYTPVLAHPERNASFIEHPDSIKYYIERGVLVQVNAGSVVGLLGKNAQQTAWELLKNGSVHFIASDGHNLSSRKPEMQLAYEIVVKKLGSENAEILFKTNPGYILKDKPVLEMIKSDNNLLKKTLYSFGKIFSKKQA